MNCFVDALTDTTIKSKLLRKVLASFDDMVKATVEKEEEELQKGLEMRSNHEMVTTHLLSKQCGMSENVDIAHETGNIRQRFIYGRGNHVAKKRWFKTARRL